MNEPQNLTSFQTAATARTMPVRLRATAAATMRKITSAKDRLHRLNAAVPPLPLDKYIADFTKGYFEFLKNALVVSGIFYMSRKTSSPLLNVVFGVSVCIFLLDYWLRAAMPVDDFIQSKKWGIALRLLSFVLLFVLLVVGLGVVVFVLDEFVRAQSH